MPAVKGLSSINPAFRLLKGRVLQEVLLKSGTDAVRWPRKTLCAMSAAWLGLPNKQTCTTHGNDKVFLCTFNTSLGLC
jgi:hypothetical protein